MKDCLQCDPSHNSLLYTLKSHFHIGKLGYVWEPVYSSVVLYILSPLESYGPVLQGSVNISSPTFECRLKSYSLHKVLFLRKSGTDKRLNQGIVNSPKDLAII